MSTARLPTIWELIAEGAGTLPEPFPRAALISWVRARRPDVSSSSISAHIQMATANAGTGAPAGKYAGRTPLLLRVGRGQYRQYRGPSVAPPDVPAGTRVILVGSTGSTSAVPVPARELFGLPGFERARDSADRSGLAWFVLSAKHGLLDPDDVVGPYDFALGEQTVDYRATWGEWVAAQLAARMPLAGVTVEVHGGVDFAGPLRKALARHGATTELPLSSFWKDERPAVFAGNRAARTESPEPPAGPQPRTALARLRHLISR